MADRNRSTRFHRKISPVTARRRRILSRAPRVFVPRYLSPSICVDSASRAIFLTGGTSCLVPLILHCRFRDHSLTHFILMILFSLDRLLFGGHKWDETSLRQGYGSASERVPPF